VDRIHDFAAPFGLGTRTGVDTTNERSGILPSRAWKRATRGQIWYPGETLNIGIGQGHMLATPMQLAQATSVLATRGSRHRPRLLHALNGEPQLPEVLGGADATEEQWDLIHAAMEAVMHGRRGSARAVGRNSSYRMAGKSGTAQVVGIAQDEEYDAEELQERHRDHGLFIAFAPLEQPTIAVAVVVENGGGGSSVAAPIARKVMDSFLLREEPGSS